MRLERIELREGRSGDGAVEQAILGGRGREKGLRGSGFDRFRGRERQLAGSDIGEERWWERKEIERFWPGTHPLRIELECTTKRANLHFLLDFDEIESC